jgi:hypothetical protein
MAAIDAERHLAAKGIIEEFQIKITCSAIPVFQKAHHRHTREAKLANYFCP